MRNLASHANGSTEYNPRGGGGGKKQEKSPFTYLKLQNKIFFPLYKNIINQNSGRRFEYDVFTSVYYNIAPLISIPFYNCAKIYDNELRVAV